MDSKFETLEETAIKARKSEEDGVKPETQIINRAVLGPAYS